MTSSNKGANGLKRIHLDPAEAFKTDQVCDDPQGGLPRDVVGDTRVKARELTNSYKLQRATVSCAQVSDNPFRQRVNATKGRALAYYVAECSAAAIRGKTMKCPSPTLSLLHPQ